MSRVAILLATYNGEKYIREQLDSLVSQTFKDFICYIHDDGSKDHTVQICREYEMKYPSKFNILKYEPTGGAKNNFLSLMRHINDESTDYVLFCDQDDIWLPNKIELLIDSVKNVKGEFLAFSDIKIVDENLNVLSESFFKSTHVAIEKIDYMNALVKGFIPGCTMMVSQGLIKNALVFTNSGNIKMHDWWIVLIALMTDAAMVYVNKPLGLYRQHSKNTIGAKNQSTIDRIKFNVKRVFDGSLKIEKKRDISTPRLQAQELYNSKIGNEDKRKFVRSFAEIGSKNKFIRTVFYLRYFHYVYRMWWMLIWV